MTEIIEKETDRLILRQWRKTDLEPFERLNADPRAMEFFPFTLSREESNNMASRCQHLIAERGWGFWALEERRSKRFIGFTGLNVPQADLPFSPCVEIGWRLLPSHWRRGFATEAAREALAIGFRTLDLDEIVAFTPVNHSRSRAVMERLHMVEDDSTFEHPVVQPGHELRRQCLYRLSRRRWRATTA